ncbi:serine/threonine-protein kinase CBK1-like [Drosophila madeirensis]|uniref:Serine/threonine-protein kinase CBK1-like n=1 Tax=Drosophila madeirensis TaxID=30013 RepID=A0AAU9FMN9_DROMD
MLAFHNEHIASCAFLTYYTPESSTATAASSPTSSAAQATPLFNDKQAISGVAYPCGALSVRRMRWQQHQQQQHHHQQQQQQHHITQTQRHAFGYPYPRLCVGQRLQLQSHQQQQQQQESHQQSSLGCLIASSRSNLRDICKTRAIC